MDRKIYYSFKNLKILLLSLLLILLHSSSGVEKSQDCRYYGNLTGWDNSRCGCCGGWIIEIEGHTFLADSIPNKKQVLSPKDTIFPIPVDIDFTPKEFCSSRIVITCIKKR